MLLSNLSLSSQQEKEFAKILQKIKLHKVPETAFTAEHYKQVCRFDKLPKTNPAIQISSESLKRVVLEQELNDEAINTRIAILRSQLPTETNYRLLNSFFVGQLEKGNAERVLKRFAVTPTNRLMIPINHRGNHWMMVVVEAGRIDAYDSMKFSGVPPILASFFTKYYGKECQLVVCDFPKQDNLIDCGMFMLCGMEDLLNGRQCTFSQKDIYAKRLALARDILSGR